MSNDWLMEQGYAPANVRPDFVDDLFCSWRQSVEPRRTLVLPTGLNPSTLDPNTNGRAAVYQGHRALTYQADLMHDLGYTPTDGVVWPWEERHSNPIFTQLKNAINEAAFDRRHNR